MIEEYHLSSNYACDEIICNSKLRIFFHYFISVYTIKYVFYLKRLSLTMCLLLSMRMIFSFMNSNSGLPFFHTGMNQYMKIGTIILSNPLGEAASINDAIPAYLIND